MYKIYKTVLQYIIYTKTLQNSKVSTLTGAAKRGFI